MRHQFVSVIIPVFNAESFLSKALISALEQPEVLEVIVIDDGSTDNSLRICNNFALKEDRIKVLQHPDQKNHGRATSRNLGIKHSKGKYIAFLDADDFYLSNRFKEDIDFLETHPVADGIYNAIGVQYFDSYKGNKLDRPQLRTMSVASNPKDLFDNMSPFGRSGYFHGNGLTVRRSIFSKSGYFNDSLEVSEDTHLWCKMALSANLYPGILESPVAFRGVHDNNVFYQKEKYNKYRPLMFQDLYEWAKKDTSYNRLGLLWKQYFKHHFKNQSGIPRIQLKVKKLRFALKAAISNPKLIRSKYYWACFPILKRLIL